MRWFKIQPKRTKIEENALQTALSIYNSDPDKYKDTMFCPYCGQPLVKSGEKRKLQTLSEHVSGDGSYASEKDVYVCSSNYYGETIPGCKYGALHVWNGDVCNIENGGSYISEFWRKIYEMEKNGDAKAKELLHNDYLMSALNTNEMEYERSIYNSGLPREKRLWPWLTLNLIQLRFEYGYAADKFGRVTGRTIHLGFLKKDTNGMFCIVGINPLHTWNFLSRDFKRKARLARKGENVDDKMRLLLKSYSKPVNKAWIYRLFHWYITKLHPFESKRVLKYYGINEFPCSFDVGKIVSKK